VLPALRLDAGGDREAFCAEAEEKLGYPIIVKPLDQGSSVGIRVAHDRDGLLEAVDYALGFSECVLAERAVRHLRELNCSVLGDREEARASEVEEPVMGDEILSYADKYGSGGKAGEKSGPSKGMRGLKRILPAPISPELRENIRRDAVTAFRALGCSGVARIDFLMDGETGEYWVNEINTTPGSLSFYLWEPVGLSYPGLLDELVKLALKRERLRGSLHREIETNILAGFNGGTKGGKI
jgi:D-alanine-D-alanine ligase